jgi:hypothetical protein
MSSSLDSFFLDRNYRWSTYAVGGGVSFFYGLVNIFALHRDKSEVALETVLLLCLFLALGIHLYHTLRKTPGETPESPTHPWQFSSVSMLTAVAVVFGSVAVLATQSNIIPRLQAAVVDARLESWNRPITDAFIIQSPEQADKELRSRFQKVQSIADLSYIYQIPVDPNSLDKAEATVRTSLKRPALSPQTKQAGLIASAKLVDVAALRSTEANTVKPPSYVINSVLELSGNNIRFKGDRSPITFGSGEILISQSTVVFDGIDLRSEQPFRQGLLVEDSRSRVTVRNSTIENLDQTLDGITWVNVQFDHSMIRIGGGSFTLVNVSFRDCDLRWLFLGPVAVELREKITRANGQPITFAFEGYPERPQKPE